MNVTPAVLPHSFEELQEKLSRLEGVAPIIQIDICDGVFGLEKTWIPTGTEVLPAVFEYEFDVMVEDWQNVIQNCFSLGAKRLVIHADHMSDDDIRTVASTAKEKGVIVGVAVSNDISVETHVAGVRVAKEIDYRSYAQVMGIARIGEQGQSFDESVPERIISLKRALGDALVQVDGAMNPENAPKVIQAGAERLIVGSYLFSKGEVASAYMEMTNLPSVCE